MIQKLNHKAVNDAVKNLKRGGVIIFPTDTVYGFLADGSNKKAVNRIFKIKNRIKGKPLPVFVKDLKSAKKIAEINKEQEKIIKKYWPGKYTFIFKKKKSVKIYGQDKKTIALRIPKNIFLISLLKKINKPLVQTSANLSSQPSINNVRSIIRQFEGLDILIIDGGNIKKGKSSKVLSLVKNKIEILRK